jgi:Fe-S-cluster containining protein
LKRASDIEESIVKWDLGHPYMIAKVGDGYCVHFDKTTCKCRIWKNRPVPCRGFDCRKDRRIWLDFENKIVNPKLPEVFERKDEKGGGVK